MCVCVGSIYFTSVSTIFDWISEAVLTVWIFYSFYFSTCICVLGYPCICVLGYPFYLCLRFSIGFWELFRQSYFLFYNVNLLIGFHFITELFFSLNLYNIYAPFYQKRTVGYSVCQKIKIKYTALTEQFLTITPKYNRKITERGKVDTPSVQMLID